MAKLVALHTNESCIVEGKSTSFGKEYTIKPGDTVEVTPDGEFLFAEKGALDTV